MSDDFVSIPSTMFLELIGEGCSAEDNHLLTALLLCANKDGNTDVTETQLAEYLGIRRETVSRRITSLAKKEFNGEPIITKTNNRPAIITISGKLGVVFHNTSPIYNELKYSEDRGAGYRSIVGYNAWKKSVKERDGACLKCGSSINLVAHHVENYSDNRELRTDINNGATLCKSCHIAFHKQYGYRSTNGSHLDEYLRKG